MTFAVTRDDTTTGVTLTVLGDIDLDTAPALVAAVDEVDLPVDGDVVIDLSAVDFLDSSGLGALVGAQKTVQAAGRKLTVVCSNPRLLTLLEITRLHTVLDVVPTLDAVPPPA